MTLPAVDFPQPLSPTNPSVCPFLTDKEIPSPAFNTGFSFENSWLFFNGKCFFILFTSNKVLMFPPPLLGSFHKAGSGLGGFRQPSAIQDRLLNMIPSHVC